MLKLFKSKHRSMLGIDISSTSVNAIEISGKGLERCIEGYGCKVLPPHAVEGHIIKDIEAVADCIKQLIVSGQFKSKFALLAVPDSAVISKVLQANNELSDSEIEEFIIMEADKYIPYPIEEISIDFEVIGPSLKNLDMLDLIIVASRSENVSSRVDAVVKAGLQVQVVDVESFAMERVIPLLLDDIPNQNPEKVIAIIDIRDEFATLFVLHALKIIYTREDEFGSQQLNDAIAHHYGINTTEVLQMKETNAFPEDYNDQVLQPFIDTLLLNIKRSLQFFFSASHHSRIDHIFLAGNVARITNLPQLIEQKTKIPTTVADITRHLTVADRVDARGLFDKAPSLLIACGLTLRSGE